MFAAVCSNTSEVVYDSFSLFIALRFLGGKNVRHNLIRCFPISLDQVQVSAVWLSSCVLEFITRVSASPENYL